MAFEDMFEVGNASNNTLESKKGYKFLSGQKGEDTYEIDNISRSWSEIDDAGVLANDNPSLAQIAGVSYVGKNENSTILI